MDFSLSPFPGAKAGKKRAKKGIQTRICLPAQCHFRGGVMGEKQDIESQILA